MPVVAIAPGFTSGFIWWPLYCSMATIELKTWPVASTPTPSRIACSPESSITRAMVKTLEIDWIENSDVGVADGVDLAVGGDERDPEQVRGHLRERRDVVGVLALRHDLTCA